MTSKDDAVPSPSKTSEDTDYSGLSNSENSQPAPTTRRFTKRVTFSEKSMAVQPPTHSEYETKQSSMLGSAGYVSQIVEELIAEEPEDPFTEKKRKPIRRQSIEEKRNSIKAVESDIGYYMKTVARMRAEEAESSAEKLPTLNKDRLEEIKAVSGAKLATKGQTSEWLPSQILGKDKGDKIEQSWVGTYVVGKDYWNPEEIEEKKGDKGKVQYPDEKKTWYEMPVHKTSVKEEAEFTKLKTKSLDKIEELKTGLDEEYYRKREERMISAAEAREKPKSFEEWTDHFKEKFKEVAKTNEFSPKGTHMSMTNADKWLENAGILDHVQLTLIHTGFCFIASGGSRHKGLSLTEFTHFLQMISCTTGTPLRDVAKRLEVSLRKGPLDE